MAVSVTTSMNNQLRDMAAQLGFDDVVIHENPAMQGIHIEIHHGPQLYTLSFMDRNPRAWIKPLQDLSRRIEHNTRTELDIRHNAVESSDDFIALLHNAREQGRRIDTVWITPEQKQVILSDADIPVLASTVPGVPIQIYGCKLRVETTT